MIYAIVFTLTHDWTKFAEFLAHILMTMYVIQPAFLSSFNPVIFVLFTPKVFRVFTQIVSHDQSRSHPGSITATNSNVTVMATTRSDVNTVIGVFMSVIAVNSFCFLKRGSVL